MAIDKTIEQPMHDKNLAGQFKSQILESAQDASSPEVPSLESRPKRMSRDQIKQEAFPLKVAQRMIFELELERQSLEAQLRLLQAAVEASNDGISISDMRSDDNEIIYVSPKLEELTGYGSDELIGHNWRMLYESEPDKEARRLMKNALAEGKSCQVSVRNIKKDGSPLLSKVTLYPLVNEFGEVTHYVSSIQDETEKRLTDKALRKAQRLDSIGLMAGGIVHDFNNILQGILTQSSILLRKLKLDDSARKNAELISQAGQRASDLTQRLLKYAREEEFDSETLNVAALIDESVRLTSSSLPTQIKLTTVLNDGATIQSYKGQVQQILINLILNAAESIDGVGKIQVCNRMALPEEINRKAGLVDLSYFSNELDTSKRYVAIDVIDTGCGMDIATLKQIFDPLFTTKEAGNGLGLAVTLGAVQAQKGALKVESQVGVGTQFSVYLPQFDPDEGS